MPLQQKLLTFMKWKSIGKKLSISCPGANYMIFYDLNL